jgi:hypothetical protein
MDDELEPMQAAMDDDQVLRCYYRMFAWGIWACLLRRRSITHPYTGALG